MEIGAGAGLSLVAIGGYCAAKLQELVRLARNLERDSIGIYNECHAMRLLDQEALGYARRAFNGVDNALAAEAQVNATMAEIDAMLDKFQQQMGIQSIGELGHDGDPFNE